MLNVPFQAALNAAKQTKDGRDEETAALRSEIEVKSSRLCKFPLYGSMYM